MSPALLSSVYFNVEAAQVLLDQPAVLPCNQQPLFASVCFNLEAAQVLLDQPTVLPWK